MIARGETRTAAPRGSVHVAAGVETSQVDRQAPVVGDIVKRDPTIGQRAAAPGAILSSSG